MTDRPTSSRLTLVRALHTLVYVVMASATLTVLYAGLSGARGSWLVAALALTGAESVVFASSGMKCPLTAVVARYAGDARVSDTFFPERITRHTLTVFGPLLALGMVLVGIRWALALWAR